MLSFKLLRAKDAASLSERFPGISEDFGYALEDGALAYCLWDGFLALRIFEDGRYSYSIAECEDSVGKFADLVEEIRRYAVLEETGLLFVGIPSRRLGELVGMFNYAEICSEDSERAAFSVRIKSEADRFDEIFPLCDGEISLAAISEEDIAEYARLCRDESGLRYWGYDYREDGDDPSDEYFYKAQAAEFYRGTAMCLGAYADGKFIGEAAFYAFDYTGGAEISFRLLPEYRGKGFGEMLVGAMISYAEELSLCRIYATADENNKPSVAVLSKFMAVESNENGVIRFVLSAQ